MLSYRNFCKFSLSYAKQSKWHREDYFLRCSLRFYNTLKFILTIRKNHFKENSARQYPRLLSIGAGGAFVEIALAKIYNYECTVLDFDNVIMLNKGYYDDIGFKSIAQNIVAIDSMNTEVKYDVVLSAENIEHIPEAPSKYIQKFRNTLAPGGDFVITTPNLGRLSCIIKLLMMTPILPPPEKTFACVSFENEGIHRREYLPSEIEAAMRACGLKPYKTAYTDCVPVNYSYFSILRHIVKRALILRRFRPCMIVAGRNA
jgi:2-polyprenyl-3-methyl-5-hydroxy-6-metoxy-1,4-benzoquinol methylase